MSIFKSKTQSHKDNTKLVGVHILKEDAHRIALDAISEDRTRSDILRDLIEGYLDATPSLNDLIKKLTEKVIQDWKDTVEKNKKMTGWKTRGEIRRQWWEYRAELYKDLIAKRIPKEIVQTIVDSVEETV